MLKHALQETNTDLIIKMGFFIGDLHRQIEQLHKEQYNEHNADDTFTLYYGLGLSKRDFERMSERKSGLISFNTFLETDKSRSTGLNLLVVLFLILI